MREVSPGDVIFSFYETRIAALGIAQSYCYESPKPDEFGTAGLTWSAIGWKVDVRFKELSNRIRPKDHIHELLFFLPEKYSPLQKDGNGLQSVYLTEVRPDLAGALFRLIGQEAAEVGDAASTPHGIAPLVLQPEATLEEWEQRVERGIRDELRIPETEKQSLIQARRGQGLFRANVQRIESQCRITKVNRPEHLIASHSIRMGAITIVKTVAITAIKGHLQASTLRQKARCWLLSKQRNKSQRIIRYRCERKR